MDATEAAAAREIENIWSKYARYMDQQQKNEVLALFTKDCNVDMADWGVFDGKDEFEAFLDDFFAGEMGIQDSFHGFFNPIIEVDGDEATGRWHYLGADTFDGPVAGWLFGFYENDFAIENGEWHISSLEFDGKWVTPYDQGWAEEPDLFS